MRADHGAAGSLGGEAAGGGSVRLRHRNRFAGPVAGEPGRHQPVRGAGQGLLHPGRPRSAGRGRAIAARCGAGCPAPTAGGSGEEEARPTRQVRPARAAPAWRRGCGLCRRHPAGKLRAQRRHRAARHGFAGAAPPRLHHDQVRGRGRQGQQGDRVLAGRARRCHPLRGGRRRHHPAPASRAAAEAAGGTGPAVGLSRHRDAAGSGAGADRGQRRDDRRRRTAPAVRRPVAAHAGRAAESHRTGRAQLQPGFAQAAWRAAVRRTQVAGAGEDPGRRALDQRGSAGSDRRPARTAAGDPGIPRPGETAQHLHRQAAGDGEPGHRPRAHQLPPGRRGHRAVVFVRSEPAEHPDPQRGRPAHPHRLRRPHRPQAGGLRLLADRVADHGPPVRRRSAGARVRKRRRRAPRDRGGSVRQAAG